MADNKEQSLEQRIEALERKVAALERLVKQQKATAERDEDPPEIDPGG